MKTRILCALLSAIFGILVTSCDKDDCSYSSGNRIPTPTTQPDPTPDPEPEAPQPVTFNQAMAWSADVLADTTVHETISGVYTNDSLAKREIRWNIAPRLEGPSYLVVMDADATVYTGADRPTTVEGNWQVTASGDSIRTDVTSGDFRFLYYQINITTGNTVGYACFSGHWEPYLPVVVNVSLHSFKSEWQGEVERGDSLFRRELTTQIFLVHARSEYSQKSFYLAKEVVIDHFLKVKEVEEDPETPTTPTVVTADVYGAGLIKYIAGNRVYNNVSWNDAYLYECVDCYLIVIAKFQVITEKGDEVLLGYKTQTVSKTVCPTVPQGGWKGVMYVDGKYYPANYIKTTGGWTWVSYVNGKQVRQDHIAQNADIQGIKNFTSDHTAEPTPIISVATDVQEVNGLKVITVTGKTSVHTITLTVADEGLK